MDRRVGLEAGTWASDPVRYPHSDAAHGTMAPVPHAELCKLLAGTNESDIHVNPVTADTVAAGMATSVEPGPIDAVMKKWMHKLNSITDARL